MSFLDMGFSPEALAEIAQFAGFAAYLDPEVQQALAQASDMLIEASRANMNWQRSTGALSDSMQRMNESPYEIDVGSDLPYARRLEMGFHGTDSLGRKYNQEARPYLEPALNENQQQILQLIENAVNNALARLGN